jgi:hypothetical protein
MSANRDYSCGGSGEGPPPPLLAYASRRAFAESVAEIYRRALLRTMQEHGIEPSDKMRDTIENLTGRPLQVVDAEIEKIKCRD